MSGLDRWGWASVVLAPRPTIFGPVWAGGAGRGGAGDHLCSSHWAGAGAGGQCQLTWPGPGQCCLYTDTTDTCCRCPAPPPLHTQPKHQSCQAYNSGSSDGNRHRKKSLQQSSVILQRRGEVHPWLYQFGEWLSTVSSDGMACLLPPCTQGRHKSQVFTNVICQNENAWKCGVNKNKSRLIVRSALLVQQWGKTHFHVSPRFWSDGSS